jgi:hypothetical protein
VKEVTQVRGAEGSCHLLHYLETSRGAVEVVVQDAVEEGEVEECIFFHRRRRHSWQQQAASLRLATVLHNPIVPLVSRALTYNGQACMLDLSKGANRDLSALTEFAGNCVKDGEDVRV